MLWGFSGSCKGCWGPQQFLHVQWPVGRDQAGSGGGWSQWYTHTQLQEPDLGACVVNGAGCRHICVGGSQGSRKEGPGLTVGVPATAGALESARIPVVAGSCHRCVHSSEGW